MYQRLYRYLFYIILFLLTYLFYIFPFETLSKYLSNETTSYEYSIINTIIFFILIVYYLRSHSTFKPLKIFVYEGLGIGFISFLIILISLLFNINQYYNPINPSHHHHHSQQYSYQYLIIIIHYISSFFHHHIIFLYVPTTPRLL